MRILFAVHDFPPEFTGGVERAAEALALALVAKGHEVGVLAGSRTTVAGDEPPRLEETASGPLRVWRWRASPRYDNVVDTHDPLCEAAFEDLLAGFRPEVLHVHHWYRLSTQLVALARRRGIAAVVTLHDLWASCARFFRLPDDRSPCLLEQAVANCSPCVAALRDLEVGERDHSTALRIAALGQELALAQTVTVGGPTQRDLLLAHGGFDARLAERLRVVRIGVLEDPSVPDRPARRRGAGEPVIVGHWGNLAAVKGVALLAEAAGRARRAADIEVRFFGRVVDDELAARLPGLAGAARVELRGVFEPEDLPEMTADLDCAAFPSLAFETHSLVLDEALAAGLPVVVSDRGAPAERVGERGLAVPAGDVGALAAALDRMADPEERERFGRGAPAPLRGRGDWATEIEGILADAVLRASEAGPAEVRDFTRDRLAFRNERLREIEVFVGALHARRADLESALRGDAAALDRVERESPDLGAMIRARGTNGE